MENNKTINKFQLFGLLLLAILLISFFNKKNQKPEFKISTSEMLIELKDYQNNTIGPEKFTDILLNSDTLYRFIDLRTPNEYAVGHIVNAINIPLQNILDENYKTILNQDEKINVLYYSTHAGACSPWMLLTQMGFRNNKILLGGYDFVKTSIIDNFSPMSGNFKDELAKYNFKEEISKLKGNSGKTVETETTTNQTVPIIKKTKETKGGGC
jgi:rhodanese-related sulfurtransferase